MKKILYVSLSFLTAFVLWTAAVCLIDVQPIGPSGSNVGFAAINDYVHRLTGTHMALYAITDWMGLIPLACIATFGVLGIVQWIKRKRICMVDFSILALGGFYMMVLAAYLLFEEFVVNYRPVLINGYLEASYPSSTTMLALCVMPTAIWQLQTRIKNANLRRIVTVLFWSFTAFMVIGRLISGVHWFTDIVGGVLLSVGLVTGYGYICSFEE